MIWFRLFWNQKERAQCVVPVGLAVEICWDSLHLWPLQGKELGVWRPVEAGGADSTACSPGLLCEDSDRFCAEAVSIPSP